MPQRTLENTLSKYSLMMTTAVTVVVVVPGPLGGRAVRVCAGGVGPSTGIVSGCICVMVYV